MPDQEPTQTKETVESGAAQTRSSLEIAAELNASALKMRNTRPMEARKLYEQAYDLAHNDDSCRTEMAASLAGLAYLNNDAGDVDLAVSQNSEAISLLNSYSPVPALVDAYCNLSWIFFSFGEFSSAMGYASKALTIAQGLQDKYWEARALDTYGCTFFADASDVDEATKFPEKAAQLFGEVGDKSEQARVYNNIADIQLHGGRLKAALEFSQKSIALAEEVSSSIVKIIANTTLSEVLIAMGEYAQAENCLQETLGQFSKETPVPFKAYLLTALAKIHLMNSQTEQAESSLLAAIEIAIHIKSIYDEVIALRILSEVYEQNQEYSKALGCLKKFTALNEKLQSEKAAKQFHALKVSSNLETAQRDAEIHRLKTVELQNEINERNRFQKELEILAITDSLTGLYNRRQFFNLANHEIEQVRRFNRAIALVLIDLDDFKQINDTFGHPTGDSVLSSIAGIFQASTRAVDILCRYGGEEFAILMPETDSTGSGIIIQRVRKALEEHNLIVNLEGFRVTFSAGIASFDTSKAHGPADLEILIKWADKALYDAKHAGKNRTVIYSP
jgi:diguanylate cyclase (GGDEF)-like protein